MARMAMSGSRKLRAAHFSARTVRRPQTLLYRNYMWDLAKEFGSAWPLMSGDGLHVLERTPVAEVGR